MVFPRDVDVASFFSVPTRQPQGSLTKIEDLIKAYGAPVVSKVQEKYPAYMTTVDAKVDTAVTLLQGIWEEKIAPSAPVAYAKSALAATPEKIEAIQAMREEYFAKIEATLEALKARAVKLPAEITTALKTAIADARAKIDDAKLFEKVQAAYRMVVEYPTVVAVIEKTAPVAAKASAKACARPHAPTTRRPSPPCEPPPHGRPSLTAGLLDVNVAPSPIVFAGTIRVCGVSGEARF